MEHVCFTLQVRDGRLDEYRERHASVWTEMQVEVVMGQLERDDGHSPGVL